MSLSVVHSHIVASYKTWPYANGCLTFDDLRIDSDQLGGSLLRPRSEDLATVPLFSELSRGLIKDLVTIGDVTGLGPEEEILREGDSSRVLNILLAGYVVETQTRHGRSVTTDVIEPLNPIQLAETLTGRPLKANIRTITTVRLVLFPVPEIRALMQQQDELLRTFFLHILTAVESVSQQLRYIKLTSAVQRLAQFLLACTSVGAEPPNRIVLPYEKRFIAGKIGCSQETLSRAFAALRKLGVTSKGSIVIVKDLAALQLLAAGRAEI